MFKVQQNRLITSRVKDFLRITSTVEVIAYHTFNFLTHHQEE